MEGSYILYCAYAILGFGALIGGIKTIDWLISQKYQTKLESNTNLTQAKEEVVCLINTNKITMSEKIETQYRQIVEKIERQTDVFQELAKSVAEISAENKIILRQFDNLNKK